MIYTTRSTPKSLLSLAVATCALPGVSMAASFQILEQSPAHLGRAFAGTGSHITDASTVFFNPAGMTELDERQVTVGGNLILIESEFNDNGSTTGGVTDKTDKPGFVPNLYLVQPINDRWSFGFGINAPFGLASSYDDDWIGRYLATESELQVVNLNATFAWAVTERLSVGLGVNYQRADVVLESQFDSTFGINPDPETDSHASIEGDDDDVVADVSVFFQPLDGTRLGLVWRQGGDFSLEGDAVFDLNSSACAPGAGFPTGAPPAPTTGTLCAGGLTASAGAVNASVELPDTLTLSVSQDITDHWSLHGDIARTEWSSISAIDIVNTGSGTSIQSLELMYDDTMRYALGSSYHNGGSWTWRFGVAFDEAPQKDPELVNPRIPDEDRTWLSAGFNYALSDIMSVDVGYAHLLVDDAEIDNVDPQTGNRVVGDFDASVNIIGVQANWVF